MKLITRRLITFAATDTELFNKTYLIKLITQPIQNYIKINLFNITYNTTDTELY